MTTDFIPGLELSRLFFVEAVRPILDDEFPGLTYSAARIDSGSEVIGFDTERSADHEWGPRLNIFVSAEDSNKLATDISARLAHQLPKEFRGYPTHFVAHDGGPIGHMTLTDGPVHHRVGVATANSFLERRLGFDPHEGITKFDWLATPWQRLREVTSGAVFLDGLGVLNELRSQLAWYPEDVWRYVLASQWQRISQEEAFVGRAGEVGDDVGSSVVAARLVRDVMRLCFLIERQWIPYGKWLGSAFSHLQIAPALQNELSDVLSAQTWKQREVPLGRCYETVAAAQNDLGLVEPVDPATRAYHGRPYVVIHAERFAFALQNSITDDALRALPPIGAVDQFVDSTDVLSHPERVRTIAAAAFCDIQLNY